MLLQSEFAMVQVEQDDTANGPRLLIRDVATGNAILLDPLELGGLAKVSHAMFAALVDTSGVGDELLAQLAGFGGATPRGPSLIVDPD